MRYRSRSDKNEGMVSAIRPQTIPSKKENAVLKAMMNAMPIPIVVKVTDVRTIVRVDGKATRLMKL